MVGTTFLYVYSCYANSAAGNPPVVDLLSWYYNYGNSDANATTEAVLENSGLNATATRRKQNLASTIYYMFLTGAPNGISLTGSSATNAACTGAHGA